MGCGDRTRGFIVALHPLKLGGVILSVYLFTIPIINGSVIYTFELVKFEFLAQGPPLLHRLLGTLSPSSPMVCTF